MVDKEDEDNWESFLARTDQAVKVIKGLASNDENCVKYAIKKADEILGRIDDHTEIIEELSHVKVDRTVINRNALNDDDNKQKKLSPEVFMKEVEVDAKNRAEERKHNVIESDRYMKEGNAAFREKDYDKALSCYTKAIGVIKDRCILYLNRALTLIRLGLCKRALQDINKALLLNPKSLKGFIYKSEAQYMLGEYEESEKTIQEACEVIPEKTEFIKDTKKRWVN